MDDKDSDEDLRLLAPGSSLGGARPKASMRDRDGRLLIDKFPNKSDEVSTVAWEAVALTLAHRAAITVPARRQELIVGKLILLSRRFDREANAVCHSYLPWTCWMQGITLRHRGVMIPVALLTGTLADPLEATRGRKPLFLVGFAVLALGGILYTLGKGTVYLIAVHSRGDRARFSRWCGRRHFRRTVGHHHF